jgi:fructose-1,6-bisphosphatase-3
MSTSPGAATLPLLRALARRFPDADAALAEIGHLRAVLGLPKGTVHVVSDVHGEHKKLTHIVHNASGALRSLVETTFAATLSPDEMRALLSLVYYPRETYARLRPGDAAERARFVALTVERAVEIVRVLSRRHTRRHVEKTYPPAFAGMLRELVASRTEGADAFRAALIEPLLRTGREIELLRALAHVIRDLSVEELVVAGDLGDRGPRIDRVIALLMRQRSVAIAWGNHDASWMGACLGQEALVATVVRISLRYRRLSQLEEGYGITMAPVEKLMRTMYADDPATRFAVKGEGLRDRADMDRMQKAMAILQLKLEGQVIARHPEWGMESRRLLHRIDPVAGTVTIDGKSHPLRDTRFPTIDWADPYALHPEEKACLERLRQSFLASRVLWEQMRFVERHGSMLLARDRALIFHGCMPVDDAGAPLAVTIDGVPHAGRALFSALEQKVRRAFREPKPDDVDAFYFLWAGPSSPLFGKDRMATFETYFVEDPATHAEHKNPYFAKIHDAAFCAEVCRELGGDPAHGLLVNGHVPVKLEKGESPLKRSGRAVTIDGAFSEAYGDKGFTLILDAAGTRLAQHHHFESVEDAVERGADVIPTIEQLETFTPPRTVADTETGQALRHEIAALEALVAAYEAHEILEVRAR